MAEAPRVFISYSHESPDHKRWVAMLATELMGKGVNAILDQWDLGPGDDVALFMEHGLTRSDRVLVVCTPEYVRKAEAGEGGVGYERLILTEELVSNIATKKFIPVIREAEGKKLKPVFLGTKYHVDFRIDHEFDAKFSELLHELHQVPLVEKPPLGTSPFATSPSGEEAAPARALTSEAVTIPDKIGSAHEAYEVAFSLARRDDPLGWSKHVMSVRGCLRRLQAWREKYDASPPTDEAGWQAAVDEAVTAVAPLVVTALVGVASGRQDLKDQRSLVDDILHVQPWNRAGYRSIIGLPQTLVFVYQGLHGATCLSRKQLRVAIELADMKVRSPGTGEYQRLWRNPQLVVWSGALGGVEQSWSYLSGGLSRWEWLRDLLGPNEADYRTALASYYMALNVHELAVSVAEVGESAIEKEGVGRIDVPLRFLSEGNETTDRAVDALVRLGTELSHLWERQGVGKEVMQRLWPRWMEACGRQLGEDYHFTSFRWSAFHKLFEPLD